MPPCRWYLYRSVTHTQRCTFTSTPSCLAKPPPELVHLKSLNGEEEHRLARSWVVDFGPDDIPKKSYETSYARSSGPGGQHVNTTSSKAVVRLPLSPALGTWLPRYIMGEVQKSPYYLPNPPALLVSSQTSRSAPENLQAALRLLHQTLKDAAERPIIGETSAEQKQRVEELVVKEKAKRRILKDKRKANKASRRGEW
ncbi:hypothetical protein DB88DRAFT_488233 [Papiliotrema laurentii]|uniref:Prokaryotic-type class I peptide chain release factors domain-containing protein n=1 Tax=Papiliotrema laurentii TaxID=5418 RepID=A0AAD9FS26_PAPLA|nr:hypothetical protein DB88DRAFT_488233 [Papiliotrema laurentii]